MSTDGAVTQTTNLLTGKMVFGTPMDNIMFYQKIKISVAILYSLFNCYKSYSQADSVTLTLSFENKHSTAQTRDVKILVTSKCDQIVSVPGIDFFTIVGMDTIAGSDVYGDGFFEVRAIGPTGKDSIMPPTNDCDKIYPIDTANRLKKLSKGQSTAYFTFPCLYTFIHGHRYRMRFYFRLSKYNPLKDVYSNWLTLNF